MSSSSHYITCVLLGVQPGNENVGVCYKQVLQPKRRRSLPVARILPWIHFVCESNYMTQMMALEKIRLSH